jgi:sialidase-1
MQENIGSQNVMSVSLLRLTAPRADGGTLGFFFIRKDGPDKLHAYLRTSEDDGASFSPPVQVFHEPGYHVMNNDRVTLTSSGRLICPVAWIGHVEKQRHFVSFSYISDDAGKTWRRGKGTVNINPEGRGALEPQVLEMNDGRLLMIVRTTLGYIAASYSTDGGETWSTPESWGVRSPDAPATVRRIPATGDLLLVWNDRYQPGADHQGKRTPLTVAISQDEGKTWRHRRNLEGADDRTFAYTSLIFVQERVVMSYYDRDSKSGLMSNRFRSLPLSWFYAAE